LNALQKVYNDSLGSSDTATVEKGVWDAIYVGLENMKTKNLMIVVDGLDDRCGHETITISEHVRQLATKHKHVKAIVLARDSAHLAKAGAQILAITPDRTHNDLHHIAKHALHGCQHFLNQKDKEREAVIENLTHAAKGNFIWVQLMAKFLKDEKSHDGFMKAIKSAKEHPESLEKLIEKLISRTTEKVEATRLLPWLLAAERPLTLAEIRSLLQFDMQKKTLLSKDVDITGDINNWCGDLVIIQNGIVRFRHGAIRESLVKMSAEGKKMGSMQTMQTDLVMKLLAYCQFRLTSPYGTSFERPEASEIGRPLLQDALLEYAVRHWINHFKKSSLHKTNGTFDFSAEFKAIFPRSVQLTMIEWTFWESQTSPLEAIRLHNLALQIRQNVFGEKHESVLQTLIMCGYLYRKVSKAVEAGTYFYRASHIGQSILKPHSTVTISCTTAFLDVTETIVSTTRTELVTRKEESLQYVISAYKVKEKTSDMVIRYYKALAELYVSIKEEHKAETIWRELRVIMISRYGEGSDEVTSISGRLVVLKKGQKHDDIIAYEKNIFDTSTEMEIWDIRRIEVTLQLAKTYEAHGELLKAEELYVLLWGGLIEHCHQIHSHHVDIEVHISMIDISLEYVRFLKRHRRNEEAAGILICIWAEYEEYDFESEVIFVRLKIVGELMRVTSLLSVAVSVFKKCWSWFKSHGKQEHTASCQVLISETINEITTTTTTTTVSTTSTTTTSTETVIKEVFESTMSKSTVTTETISICQSLVSFYIQRELWSEAIITSKKSLELIWKTIVSGRGTIALPREFGSDAINIAIRLAICYHRSHQFHEAETVYLRIYQACFNSCHIHDERLTKAYTALIHFYEEHGYWQKSIEIYREVLVASRKQHGTVHPLTIKTLYTLGSLCSEHGHGHAQEYYEEIITVLNGSSHFCHHDAMTAMKIMCRSYFEQGHWHKLKHTCEVLWETWIHHHHEHKIEADFIDLLYMRYIYVLEHHSHAEYEIIRGISIQFRDTCVKAFGGSVAITIKSLIELAQICMRSEKHIHEAIGYYEEVSLFC
jgi:tetratricopeptide (TPR) repeat protein